MKLIRIIDDINTTSFDRQLLYYIAAKKTFEVHETSVTKLIKTEKRKYFFSTDHDPFKLLGLAAKVKAEILRSQIPVEPCRVDYFGCCEPNEKLIAKECFEVDITAAYINMAYCIGYISKATKDEILKLEKSQRLKILGRLATQKTITKYAQGLEVSCERAKLTLEQKYLRDVWFDISYKTDCLIKDCINICCPDGTYLFYWVDAIFVKNKVAVENIEK